MIMLKRFSLHILRIAWGKLVVFFLYLYLLNGFVSSANFKGFNSNVRFLVHSLPGALQRKKKKKEFNNAL